MNDRKILITGASGFLGSHLCRFYQKQDCEVIGWDIVENKNCCQKFRAIDLTRLPDVRQALEEDGPDLMIHCAGLADVSMSVQFPEQDYSSNVTATHNLLLAMETYVKKPCRDVKLLFVSSAAVYGNPGALPICEESPYNPQSPYALHKVICEEICKYEAQINQLDISIARIFSVYGEGLKKQIFWDMYHKLTGSGSLDMLGTGEESRDYIYVSDVVYALDLILKAEQGKGTCPVYNVANGIETTIRHAVEVFAEVNHISKDVITFSGNSRKCDPRNWRADISKLKELGYRQRVDLKNGLEFYVKWANLI